jgi:hypothetical protein
MGDRKSFRGAESCGTGKRRKGGEGREYLLRVAREHHRVKARVDRADVFSCELGEFMKT